MKFALFPPTSPTAIIPKKDRLLTSDFAQSYGALQKNPRGEVKYKEFFNGGGDKLVRARNFKAANPVVNLLSKSVSVEKLLGLDFTQNAVQKLLQMKAASDMIVLDILMNQQDRFGNIHAEERYFYLDENKRLKSKDELTAEEIARLKPVKAMRVLLKDNDCGGSDRENVANQAGLADVIHHMDPSTYTRLLKLNKVMHDQSVKDFFARGLLFTSSDLNMLTENMNGLARKLYERCRSGKLFLDLDVKNYFTGAAESVSCEI